MTTMPHSPLFFSLSLSSRVRSARPAARSRPRAPRLLLPRRREAVAAPQAPSAPRAGESCNGLCQAGPTVPRLGAPRPRPAGVYGETRGLTRCLHRPLPCGHFCPEARPRPARTAAATAPSRRSSDDSFNFGGHERAAAQSAGGVLAVVSGRRACRWASTPSGRPVHPQRPGALRARLLLRGGERRICRRGTYGKVRPRRGPGVALSADDRGDDEHGPRAPRAQARRRARRSRLLVRRPARRAPRPAGSTSSTQIPVPRRAVRRRDGAGHGELQRPLQAGPLLPRGERQPPRSSAPPAPSATSRADERRLQRQLPRHRAHVSCLDTTITPGRKRRKRLLSLRAVGLRGGLLPPERQRHRQGASAGPPRLLSLQSAAGRGGLLHDGR